MNKNSYKAKRLYDGQWVKGNLFIGDDGSCEIIVGTKHQRVSYDVGYHTICRITGQRDCNGIEIWENDIVDISYGTDSNGNGIVNFNDGRSMFEISCDGFNYNFSNIHGKDVEVIGNLWDEEGYNYDTI